MWRRKDRRRQVTASLFVHAGRSVAARRAYVVTFAAAVRGEWGGGSGSEAAMSAGFSGTARSALHVIANFVSPGQTSRHVSGSMRFVSRG